MKINTEKKYSKNAIISICALIYFVSYFARKDFAASMVGIIKSGAIDKPTAGLVEMGMFIAYGVGQLISGYLGDRISPKILLLTGLSTTALCNLAMPFVSNSYLMIPLWALNGLAQAMLWPPIVRMLAQYLDHKKYVTANLIVTSAAHTATIILYVYTSICLNRFSWRTVFFTASILSGAAITIFIISMFLILPKDGAKTPVKASENGSANRTTFRILLDSGVLWIFGSIVMMGILRDGIESWLPTIYCEVFDRTPEEATLLSVILPIFSILSIVLIKIAYKSPIFSNEVRGAGIMFISSAVLCIPLCFFIRSDIKVFQISSLVLAALICGCMHACNFLLISCLPGRFAKFGKAATTSGFSNACTYVGAAIASYGFALVEKHFGWSITILSWIGVCAIGVLFAAIAFKSYNKFIKEQE